MIPSVDTLKSLLKIAIAIAVVVFGFKSGLFVDLYEMAMRMLK